MNDFMGEFQINVNRTSHRKTYVIMMGLILGFLGCDDIPSVSLNSNVNLSSLKTNVVATDGRSSYDWNPTNSGFEITRETRVQYIDRIADSFQCDRINANPEDNQPWERPDWLDNDDVCREFQAFIETGDLKLIATIPTEKPIPNRSLYIDPDFQNAYWTDGGKIHVVGFQSPHSSTSWNSPLPDATGLCVGFREEFLYLYNDVEIVKVSVADRQIVKRIKLPEPIETWVIAKECDAICAATKSKELIAIDEDLSSIRVARGYKLINNSISIHPKGFKVLAAGTNGAIRWNLRGMDQEFDAPTIHPNYLSGVTTSCGEFIDTWVSVVVFSQHIGDKPKRFQYLSKYNNFDAFGTGLAVFDCTRGNDYNYTLGFGYLKRRDNRYRMFMIDFGIGDEWIQSSEPAFFPSDDSFTKIEVSKSGHTIATYIDDRIEMYKRPFSDMHGFIAPVGLIGTAARDDRMDLVEKLAEELRRRDWPAKGWTGEQAYCRLVEGISTYWASLDVRKNSKQDNDVMREALEKWREQDSTLSRICSAKRYIELGRRVRGGGYADTVSPEAWQKYEQYNKLCAKELKEVIKQERPPACVYLFKCNQLIGSGGTLEDFELMVEKCMNLYPSFIEVHLPLQLYLLPRWGGSPGESGAYINAVANLYAPEIRDYVYAMMAAQQISLISIQAATHKDAGIYIKRIIKGSQHVLKLPTRIPQVLHEWLIHIANEDKSNPIINDLADRYLSDYPMVSADAYGYPSYDTLFRRKLEMAKGFTKSK